jgi:putative spermidine/putrescine transport system ATP-binding protein
MKLDAISVTLANCSKTFGTHRVLEPVDLRIGAGETLVLLGPSGCGKTTTLRMIAGLETPDAGGRVRFDDDDVTHLPIERRQVGMVFQSYALFPNLNVRDNIAYGLKIRKMPREAIHRRVDELLALTELQAHGDKAIDALSGGQRQRVALARALAPQPRILLLDEPLTALDARLRDTLRTEMNALLRELGVTTVYVTHDQAEAMALGDRIVVMSAGRIEQIGTPREVYFKPVNRSVAQFIGTMNQLSGQLRHQSLLVGDQMLPLAPRDSQRDPQRDSSRLGTSTSGAGSASLAPVSGDRVQAFFRPEDVVLSDAGSGQLQGKISSAVFLGDKTRLVLDLANDTPLTIDVPGRTTFNVGENVGMSLRPDALMLLD